MTDIGLDYEVVERVEEGLETLSAGLGIEVATEILPFAAAIVLGYKLIKTIRTTRKELSAEHRTVKNKVAVVQTLTLFSRYGIRYTLTTAGAAAVSGIGMDGGATGFIVGTKAAKKLQPHLLPMALRITGLMEDDLFYYRKKQRIDALAEDYRSMRLLASG